MNLWEVEVVANGQVKDREAGRIVADCQALGLRSIRTARTARLFLLEGELTRDAVEQAAAEMLVDGVVESHRIHHLAGAVGAGSPSRTPHDSRSTGEIQLQVLFKPGVTDNVGESVRLALAQQSCSVTAVRTGLRVWLNADATATDLERAAKRVLSNDAIQQVLWGELKLKTLSVGTTYQFEPITVALRGLDDEALTLLSSKGQLYLSLAEMRTIQAHYDTLGREPSDIELETIAQTWSEHCSHKTLRGRVSYRDENGVRTFTNLLKETIFAATSQLRKQWGADDWCVSVFEDNAGVVKFTDDFHVCMKVETHNHPSAIEPYGGANTGLGGVIRDPLGTGLGAKPVCNTDVFCFAPPDVSFEDLPQGVLHPRAVAHGVVAGVRDYGNRMGIPTVNGAVYFDKRYLGNPLVYCGNVAMLPVGKVEKQVRPGDYIVAVGGKTGRDGIHGATFSSAELTAESESISGGSVQIGDAVTEKMVLDVILQARDQGLYTAITDCGAGGFSSAVGEMGAETGAEVFLDRAPLKYAGLSYTEIWISEAQERMVLCVPQPKWPALKRLCESEGVGATVIGEFRNHGRLVLRYGEHQVGELSMHFLHEGRPPVVREATYEPPVAKPFIIPKGGQYEADLVSILGSLNVCSKEWIIRQYDHEVQGGSVVKPLVGVRHDGPSDAAVVRPLLHSQRGLVIANGMNPHYGDADPYWMAAAAIDEAVRNCVAVGADPARIAILDNFCWGNTERAETLGSLVRAALACRDVALAFGTPFISGKDSLNNEFTYYDYKMLVRRTVAIPSSLLISALGQIEDVSRAVTMDLKQAGNQLFLVGGTRNELGGSHWSLVRNFSGGTVPRVDLQQAPRVFQGLHRAMAAGCVRSCHDLSEGGLAVALAEMCFAGELGADIRLAELCKASDIADAGIVLFSESTSRFVIEVEPRHVPQLRERLGKLPCIALGEVTTADRVHVQNAQGATVLDTPWSKLKAAWKRPLAW